MHVQVDYFVYLGEYQPLVYPADQVACPHLCQLGLLNEFVLGPILLGSNFFSVCLQPDATLLAQTILE